MGIRLQSGAVSTTQRKRKGFNFRPGRLLAGKYRVESKLGGGWEGEVYHVVESRTGIARAAKIFYPERNKGDRSLKQYAIKLNRLRHCPILIQYHHTETIQFNGSPATILLSDLVEGEPLTDFLKHQPGKRLYPFEAMHVLAELASGLAYIHRMRDYHGDVHEGNILIRRRGIHFEVKLVDLLHHGRSSAYHRKEDVLQLIRVFYEVLGGKEKYSTQPPEVKAICCGLKRALILEKFPTASHLLDYLHNFEWESR